MPESQQIGALCVTAGPSGTNAITGVVGGWLDSSPCLFYPVRCATTPLHAGPRGHPRGDQDFDIVRSIDRMTKYSEMVIDPLRIRYCLEKALYLANIRTSWPDLAGHTRWMYRRVCRHGAALVKLDVRGPGGGQNWLGAAYRWYNHTRRGCICRSN